MVDLLKVLFHHLFLGHQLRMVVLQLTERERRLVIRVCVRVHVGWLAVPFPHHQPSARLLEGAHNKTSINVKCIQSVMCE
jgi:hypothetical protein